MANLGIKINVDFSEANRQFEAFEKKWRQLEDNPVKIKVDVDTKKVTRLANSIKSVFGGDNEKNLKINLDVSDALKNLNRFKEEFSKVKKEFEGMGFKTKTPSSELFKTDDMFKIRGEMDKIAQKFSEINSQSQNVSVNFKRGIDGSVQTVTNITSKIDDAKSATLKMVDGITTNVGFNKKESSIINDYISMYKEYMSLKTKALSSGEDSRVIESQINKIKSAMKDFEREYKDVYGKDIKNLDAFKALKEQSEFKFNLKMEEKGKQELDGFLRDIKSLYGKKIKLEVDYDNASAKQKGLYKSQLDNVNKQITALYSNINVANPAQARKSVDGIVQEFRYQEAIKNALAEEKSVMSSLVKSQREMLKIKKQIAELDVYKSEGTITAKEEYKLKALKDELKLKQQIYNAELESNRKSLSKSSRNQLTEANNAHNTAIELAKSQAKTNSEIRESNSLYDEMESSLRKVVRLTKQLANSGQEQADEIKRVISQEEEYQSSLRNTIRLRNLDNEARDKAYAKAKQQAGQELEESIKFSNKREDDNRRYSGLAGQVLNPRAMYQDVRQGFQTIYDSIAKVDEQFVNIAKVADAPQAELDKFGDTIYKQASKVGKAADEYGVSVARWLTTGKSLKESIKLSQTSVMGGFVGNIDEESMVKYMSVPLENYKNSALQATDIINTMNEVSNNNAVEMNDLGEAYERAAQTASSAGTTFAQLTGLIAGANTTTRAGGEKIGTAIKAIDLNISNIGAKLTRGSGDKFRWLEDHGVSLKDANGQLRTTYDVLNDLQKVWNNLSSNDKGTATFYLAGKHHAPILQGIVKGWDTVQKATKEAEGQLNLVDKESGSAFEEFYKQQDSVQFATAQLTNAWGEFLNKVAGGKDGIVDVLNTLKEVLGVATKLAQNQGIRTLTKTIGELAAITAGTITLQRFMGSGKAILGDAKIALGNAGSLFKRKNRTKFSEEMYTVANTIGATTQLQKANNITPFTKNISKESRLTNKSMNSLASGAKKTSGIFSKLGGIIGATGSIISGLVPIIGTVIGILTLLDATGLPVFETLGKGVEKIGEHFESASKKAKKANQEFVENQKKLGKELDKNKLLSGGIDRADDVIERYKQIQSEKEKASAQSGEPLRFSTEEYSDLKKQFNQTAKDLGFNIRITMNDYDDIKQKLEDLINLKNQLTADELTKFNETFENKFSKPKDLSKDKDAFDEDVKKQKESLKDYEDAYKATVNARKRLSRFASKKQKDEADKAVEDSKKALNQVKKDLKEFEKNGFERSKYASDADTADKSRFTNIENARKKLSEQARAGTLSVGFNAQSKEYQRQDLAMLVTQYNKDKENIDKLTRIKTEIERAKGEAEKGNTKGSKLNNEALEYIRSLGGSYKDLNGYVKDNTDMYLQALNGINEETGKATEGNKQLKDSLQELGNIAGLSKEDMDNMYKAMESGGADFAKYMLDTFGDVGGALLNVTSMFQNHFGENWKTAFVDIQKQVDNLKPEDKEFFIKYKLVNEDGTLNSENYMKALGLPEEIKTKFKLVDETTGELNLNNFKTFIDTLSKSDISANIKSKITNGNGEITLDSFMNGWAKLEKEGKTKELVRQLKLNVKGKDEVDQADKKLNSMNGKKSNSSHNIHTNGKGELDNAVNEQNAQNGKETNSKHNFNGDNTDFNNKKNETENGRNQVNNTNATVEFKGDKSNYDIVRAVILSSVTSPIVQVVQFVAQKVGDWFTGGNSGGKSGKGGKSNGKESVSIDSYSTPSSPNRSVGRAYSASINEGVNATQTQPLQQNSNAKHVSYSTSSSSDTNNSKVDEDVWRYWSKELFNGIPLERSMSDLEEAIKQADENNDKLSLLYRQQIDLLQKQIDYQKSLESAKQQEMNEVLAELRKKGFQTNGNQITNLDIAKNMTGESAEKASELLNRWKSLYEDINSIATKISSLNSDKFEAQKNYDETGIKIENEHLTRRAKIIEAYLKNISNHTDLITQKIDFVSDKDTDLKIQTLSEGIVDLSKNVNDLIGEFNGIAVSTTAHKENGDVMMDNLENIKSQILENIDAMIKWQEKINDLRIDGLISDFDRFNNVISKNSDFLDNNITNLKEGLLSGTKYSDLQSSQLVDLTYSYRDQLQKQYEQRLEIEKALDKALEDFAARNIERTNNAANGALLIEKKKYEQLLNMKAQYEAGKAPSYEEIKVEHKSLDEYVGKFNDEYVPDSYKAWRDQMQNVNAQYARRLEELRSRYDAMLDGARTEEEKTLVTQRLITEQLEIQRDIQNSLISTTKQAIANAEAELKNTDLTSEQQEKLIDAIEEYRQTMIDAQNKIKETIKAKYDLEFDYMDKLADKASNYSSIVDNLASIADKINMQPADKTDILQRVFESKVNEFVIAKSSMEKLLQEQNSMEVGSYEWNILEEKIKELKEKMHSFTLEMLEANKDMLSNKLDAIEDTLSRKLLGGMNLDEWEEHNSLWVSGVEKELKLEEIRKRLIDNENETIKRRIEALDLQKEVSKKDLEYLDKQTKLLELENKLRGIQEERNVQTLKRDENGAWNWEYVYDQSDYDKTKEEYDKAKEELEEYRRTQRGEYVKALQTILGNAKDGKYKNSNELYDALNNINKVYGMIISDIPDMNINNGFDEIISAYEDYLNKNNSIIEDSVNDKEGMFTTSDLDKWGETFKDSFQSISQQLGETIGNAVRNALNNANSSLVKQGVSSSYVIQKQELSFPNVTDTNGFEKVLVDLPKVATQRLTNK